MRLFESASRDAATEVTMFAADLAGTRYVFADLKALLTPLEKVRQPDFARIIERVPGWLDRWNKEIR